MSLSSQVASPESSWVNQIREYRERAQSSTQGAALQIVDTLSLWGAECRSVCQDPHPPALPPRGSFHSPLTLLQINRHRVHCSTDPFIYDNHHHNKRRAPLKHTWKGVLFPWKMLESKEIESRTEESKARPAGPGPGRAKWRTAPAFVLLEANSFP